MILILRPEFLLVDLRDFFFQSQGTKKKSSENDQSELFFDWSFSELFFLYLKKKKTVKLTCISKVNQHSVLNFYIFHHFP